MRKFDWNSVLLIHKITHETCNEVVSIGIHRAGGIVVTVLQDHWRVWEAIISEKCIDVPIRPILKCMNWLSYQEFQLGSDFRMVGWTEKSCCCRGKYR